MARSVNTKVSKTSALRISGGEWRGQKLPIVDLPGLRPTGSRIRETLFNWLQADLTQRRCLDLFAGSGALSFEALSRGAREAHLVELEAAAAKQLRANVAKLHCTSARIYQTSALSWLSQANFQEHFDLVFLDPPFAKKLWLDTLDALQTSGILKSDALIYIEHPKSAPLAYPGLTPLKEKTSGEVRYGLYRLSTSLLA
ncbi:MAG: 16S rRNA (guanine(966)-N(2))-methyltransferase RsmD [Cellvibrionaceae bacterium]|nr:16S rRNA (guanine(966)-N(2))-methyltransferase RsmD [Cellvibrionaceae bacterium]